MPDTANMPRGATGGDAPDGDGRGSSPLSSAPSSFQGSIPDPDGDGGGERAGGEGDTPASSPPKALPLGSGECGLGGEVDGFVYVRDEDVIDPVLKELASAGGGGGGGVEGGAGGQVEEDYSWLPEFTANPETVPSVPTVPTQGHHPWQLDTNVSAPSFPSTGPPSSDSSPDSALPGWQSGYGTSMSDLKSLVAGERVGPSGASSESGFETGGCEDVPAPKKKSHARKQPEGHIKRARNAFILFRKHITDSNLIPPSVEVKHQNISVVAAKMWKEAPQEVRFRFQEQARLEKEEHQRKYPGYRYQPVFRRTDIIRRRVRKDPAEDEKVEAVAEALIHGKAGDALESEMKEQLVTRSEASESEAESSRSTRRRKRETGQLSKGAIRAQRAQARAKQMRQNLLGTNLLNVSLYNAANARLASTAPTAPGERAGEYLGVAQGHTHPGMQYAMESYLPMGYGLGGRPVAVPVGGYADVYGAQPAQGGDVYGAQPAQGGDTYRLPPIDGMMGAGNGYEWQAPEMEYWSPGNVGSGERYPVGEEGYYRPSYAVEGEYHLPPLVETSREGQSRSGPGDIIASAYGGGGELAGMRQWTNEQTPSGHVLFSERLFDGALGSATMRNEEDLGMFDQAMEQAGEIPRW